jgi:hypothetical protein
VVLCSFAKRELYTTLDQIRTFLYSKRQINLWMNATERGTYAPAPQPPLFVDEHGGEWTSVTHLATYIRWGREHTGVVNNKALAGLVVELGGKRWQAKAWDDTTRQRQRRIVAVLLRLPAVGEDSSEQDGDDA